MDPIRSLIVDDEPPARHRLRRMLAAEPGVAVVAECGAVGDAVEQLRLAGHINVIFLDVRMPGRDGFSLLDELAWEDHHQEPAVVFVTAYAEHAARAFDVRAVDYLLKPFSQQRLRAALDRVREAQARRAAQLPPPRRLPVEAGGRIRLLDLEQVEYLRAEGNYVRVCTPAGSHLTRGPLNGLAARLPASQFCRIHRSLVVRLDSVREVEVLGHGELALHLHSGATVISGRSYREQVRTALGL